MDLDLDEQRRLEALRIASGLACSGLVHSSQDIVQAAEAFHAFLADRKPDEPAKA